MSLLRIMGSILFSVVSLSMLVYADPVPVRFAQGSSHGYLALKTLEGKLIATGESTQTVRGDQVTARLIFYFKDGSIDDDVTVFSQRKFFKVVSDHHVQRGPSFPHPIDFLMNGVTGQLTFRAEDGKVSEQHMDLPADVSNGLPPNLLLNILPSTAETKVSYVVPGAKARLVHLSIKPKGTLPFSVGGLKRKATDYTIHIELGGAAGVIAPLIGKQPTDYDIWIQAGRPPAFVREEGALYEGGPIWRIESIMLNLPR